MILKIGGATPRLVSNFTPIIKIFVMVVSYMVVDSGSQLHSSAKLKLLFRLRPFAIGIWKLSKFCIGRFEDVFGSVCLHPLLKETSFNLTFLHFHQKIESPSILQKKSLPACPPACLAASLSVCLKQWVVTCANVGQSSSRRLSLSRMGANPMVLRKVFLLFWEVTHKKR